MLAATVATLSSASKRPAPSSASPSGTILAQGSQSQPPQRSRTCQNSSPRAPVRPDPATGFAPLTKGACKPFDLLEKLCGSTPSERAIDPLRARHFGTRYRRRMPPILRAQVMPHLQGRKRPQREGDRMYRPVDGTYIIEACELVTLAPTARGQC